MRPAATCAICQPSALVLPRWALSVDATVLVVSSGSKRSSPHDRATRSELDQALAALRSSDPVAYAEHMALTVAVIERAERWRSQPVRLPRDVALVVLTEPTGRTIHALDWHLDPPPTPPGTFLDPAVAVELAWTAFMLRRPWAIDDARLRAIVEHPPAPHAFILGDLLSIRFADWICTAFGTMAVACIDDPPPAGIEALEPLLAGYASDKQAYQARASVAIHELSGLFDVAEPDSGLMEETGRWRWMLYDYTRSLDEQLHERLEALAVRYATAPVGVEAAWNDLSDRRLLDACTGLLLAHVLMLDLPARPTGFTDPMSTRAVGSFAWWCRWIVRATDDDYPLGDRLRLEEVEPFLGFACHTLEQQDPALLSALLCVFPTIAP